MSITDKARYLRKNMTKAEKLLWHHLRNRQRLGFKFLRQFPVLYSEVLSQKSYFILDFYCHQARLCIEIDGKYHDSIVEEDNLRDEILSGMRLKTIRFTNVEVIDRIEIVLKIIDDILSQSL